MRSAAHRDTRAETDRRASLATEALIRIAS
jgi:hypothetical protein